MVPKEFRKNLCVIAGWVTLVEAVVWGGFSIFLVGVYGCSWNYFYTPKGPNTWSMLYVTYFMGSCQGAQGAKDLGFTITPPTEPARHLHIWLWVSVVVSVVWIPACVLLTVAASIEVRGKHGALLYYPWVAVSTVIAIIDLGGAIYHFIDFVQSTTPDHYATLTGASSWASLTGNTSSEGVVSWLPSLLVTFFFCRSLVLWLINLYFLFGVYKGCNAVALYTTKYLQSSMMPEENKKSWRNRFYQGPDPALFDQRGPLGPHPTHQTTEDHRYRTEDLRPSDGREVAHDLPEEERGERGPRSPFKPGVFDYSGRPIRSDSFRDQWRNNNNAPPIASGVQVPPELNKNEPFSYIAGDQPQKMRRPLSRSNSRGDQPPIPRPDYAIADRRAASLEYVPNRFRVPSPKRPQTQSAFNLDSAGRPVASTKVAPVPPKKYPRSIPEEHEMRYIPPHAGAQQPSYYTRQTPAQDYNINKLY